MSRFAIASTTPVLCILLTCFYGGLWTGVAVASITLVVFFLDKLTPEDWQAPLESDGLALSVTLGLVHFVLMGCVVWAVSCGNHLTALEKNLIVAAASLWFGQVSNSNAHELIHRTSRWPRRLGVALYSSLLFGHHASAHLRVHHVHASTDKDPNSSRLNEWFYAFAWRAWTQSYAAGFKAESMARARASRDTPMWRHPYVLYCMLSLGTMAAAFAIGGVIGVVTLVGLALYSVGQLLLSDYVQHYGLRRRILADGKYEPIGPAHAWNAPHWYSSAMMLNAPRHSEHHLHPGRAFPQLDLDGDTMPMLPHALPVMAVIALIPPIWMRVMNARVAEWDRKTAPRPARQIAPQGAALSRKGGLIAARVPNLYDDTEQQPYSPRPEPHDDHLDGSRASRTDERG
ncbi:alkane 1-monooxygenase [Ascidiaceihabitans sp.]|uniref:alkane 1-monooxygenase n=1 Tax=Ascidiaceihabitans sp. TaxID=1872644 RepID=UPI003298C9F1